MTSAVRPSLTGHRRLAVFQVNLISRVLRTDLPCMSGVFQSSCRSLILNFEIR